MGRKKDSALRRLQRVVLKTLRSRKLILVEVGAIAIAGAILTLVPQATGPATETAAFETAFPSLTPILQAIQFDRVLWSTWFLFILTLSCASLAVVLNDQFRKALKIWLRRPRPSHFARAPYRLEFERPARSDTAPVETLERRGRIAVWGLPMLHLGLLTVVLAGVIRMLWGQDAVVDLIEGETLPTSPTAYGAQWNGPFAGEFSFADPITFEELDLDFYESGRLRNISGRVRVGEGIFARVAINEPLVFGSRQLYLSQTYGPAAIVAVEVGGVTENIGVPMSLEGKDFVGLTFVHGMELRLRGQGPSFGALQVRLLKDGGLAFVGSLAPGQSAELPTGGRIELLDIRKWARFNASRDVALWLAYTGFGLITLGALLLFAVVQVDTYLKVSAGEDGRELVLVAMRPKRFVPLFKERFEAFVESEGHVGPLGAMAQTSTPPAED